MNKKVTVYIINIITIIVVVNIIANNVMVINDSKPIYIKTDNMMEINIKVDNILINNFIKVSIDPINKSNTIENIKVDYYKIILVDF